MGQELWPDGAVRVVEAERSREVVLAARVWTVARVLATLAAAVAAVAVWLPWVGAIGVATVEGQQTRYLLQLSPVDVQSSVFNVFVWSVLSVLGILLAAMLWQPSQKRVAALGVALFGLWAAAYAIAGVVTVSDLLHNTRVPLTPALRIPELRITGAQLLGGLWLAIGGFLVTVVALALMAASIRGAYRAPHVGAEASTPLRRRLPGTAAVTLGGAIWAFGFLGMPWATVNCTAMPLLVGRCIGIGSNGAIAYAVARAPLHIDPLMAFYAGNLLQGLGGLLLLYGLWWRRLSSALCLWATLWLLAAVGFFVLGDVGVGIVTASALSLGLPSGTWRGDTGVPVTFAGLVIVLFSLVPLWRAALTTAHKPGA